MNEERSYCKLKKSIRMKKKQRSHIETNKMIEYGKILEIAEIIKQNEGITNINVKHKYFLESWQKNVILLFQV